MIRALRHAHRAAFTGLAVVIPTLLVLAWRARPEPADMDRLPRELQLPSARSLAELVPVDDSLTTNQPDALVYWSATGPADGELPGDARLLGLEHEGVAAADGGEGWLVVFSLARGEVLSARRTGRPASLR